VLLDRHGHGWPGGRAQPGEVLMIGPRTDAIDATEVIWDFFDGQGLDLDANPGPANADLPTTPGPT
jgi:poly(3-hydroxybutyrate) depolymerase